MFKTFQHRRIIYLAQDIDGVKWKRKFKRFNVFLSGFSLEEEP